MEREVKILISTVKYGLVSLGLTGLIVWENREWYWSWWAGKSGLGEKVFIATGVMEELVGYVWLAVLIGAVIGQLRVGGLLMMYMLPGLYRAEGKRLTKLIIIIGIVNMWVVPRGLEMISSLVLSGRLLPKYIDICQYYWVGQVYGQGLWVGGLIFMSTRVSEVYIKSRPLFMVGVGLVIGLITPPDITITIGGTLIIFILCEALVLTKKYREAKRC